LTRISTDLAEAPLSRVPVHRERDHLFTAAIRHGARDADVDPPDVLSVLVLRGLDAIQPVRRQFQEFNFTAAQDARVPEKTRDLCRESKKLK
jgi:hypothetical protein